MKRIKAWLRDNKATVWEGTAELWEDPQGNEVKISDCALRVEPDKITYQWIYEGSRKTGSFDFSESLVLWRDSWHQASPTECDYISASWSLFAIEYTYAAAPGPSWGWRINLSERPDMALVLQMTNIAPWGEEGRAVRMVFTQQA